MTRKLVTYRVQHPKTALGLFHDQTVCKWETADYEYAEEIRCNFKRILNMYCEFPEEIFDRMSDYKCAFKSLNHMIEILPPHLLKYLVECNFEVVRVEGVGIHANTQTFFRDVDVTIKSIPLGKVLRVIAKRQALRDIGQSVIVTDYIIQSA